MECEAELITHSHPAARQSENQYRRIVAVLSLAYRPVSARLFPIAEHDTSVSFDTGR